MHTPVPVGFDKDTKITIGIPAYNMRARGKNGEVSGCYRVESAKFEIGNKSIEIEGLQWTRHSWESVLITRKTTLEGF